jgi:hypothetical protein
MPKIVLKGTFKNTKSLLTILLLLCFHHFFAQNTISIAYNDKINLGTVAKTNHFYITSGATKIHLKGNEINDYVFKSPGTYHIEVTQKKARHSETCREILLPKEIVVTVSRIKMTFDSNRISFSTPIIKNIDTKGIILSIPIAITTFDHLPAPLNFTPVNSMGIGSAITATLDATAKELPEGTHTLQYHLNGIVTENSYLMFDFLDANGNTQTVSLVTPVKN